ncbi:DUF7213 family protein [Mycolicibacterium porcinum]|uniref:Uncharacterized protein n=1 Tax=Mycolicibacterium porcinum TaxID=39693 RepID=A0ABV3VI54_9MYCO
MSELDEDLAARRRDAYAKLDEAIEELSAVFCEVDGEIPVDAVLIVGAQSVDDDGDRGSQPLYITSGLMSHGLAVLAHQGVAES